MSINEKVIKNHISLALGPHGGPMGNGFTSALRGNTQRKLSVHLPDMKYKESKKGEVYIGRAIHLIKSIRIFPDKTVEYTPLMKFSVEVIYNNDNKVAEVRGYANEHFTGDILLERSIKANLDGDGAREEKIRFTHEVSDFHIALGAKLEPIVAQLGVAEQSGEAPSPETNIKDNSNGGADVRKFVSANVEAITDAYSFTTVFIDTDAEYKKYGVSVPSVALICTDLRKTVASLKRDPLVVKFNKSKTLKRVSEWVKGKFRGFDKQVWYTMYSSAKAVRVNESEETGDMSYLGFLNEDGTVAVAPCVGETIEMEGRMYPIVEAEDCYIVQNGSYTLLLDESEISEDIELDESECDGLMIGDYVVIGLYEDCLVLSDSNDFCYLYEASLDVKSNGVQQGALVLSVNGKIYKYTSDKFSANELEEKFDSIAKHSVGRAYAWIKKNCVTQDSYAKNKQSRKHTGEEQLSLFEEAWEKNTFEELDEAELTVEGTAVNGKTFTVHINGKKYSYAPLSDSGLAAKDLKKKFDSIAKHSVGKALAWLKKNATTKDSYRKSSVNEDYDDDDDFNEDAIIEFNWSKICKTLGSKLGYEIDTPDWDNDDGWTGWCMFEGQPIAIAISTSIEGDEWYAWLVNTNTFKKIGNWEASGEVSTEAKLLSDMKITKGVISKALKL